MDDSDSDYLSEEENREDRIVKRVGEFVTIAYWLNLNSLCNTPYLSSPKLKEERWPMEKYPPLLSAGSPRK